MTVSANRLPDDVLDYYKRIFFCFAPNVCNAQCEFCYVSPSYAFRSALTDNSLERLRVTFNTLASLGFEEVRFTGGEPLIVEQFDRLVTTATEVNLDYTVLTNGLKLGAHANLFRSQVPKKITVSVHSVDDAQQWFGVDWDTPRVIEAIRELTKSGIDIAISALYSTGNDSDYEYLLSSAKEWGACEFKLIFPNVPPSAARASREEFDQLAARLSRSSDFPGRFRFTNLHRSYCELRERGRFSLTIPGHDAYPCCVQVGGGMGRIDEKTQPDRLAEILLKTFEARSTVAGFGCLSHIGSCPLSLSSTASC